MSCWDVYGHYSGSNYHFSVSGAVCVHLGDGVRVADVPSFLLVFLLRKPSSWCAVSKILSVYLSLGAKSYRALTLPNGCVKW